MKKITFLFTMLLPIFVSGQFDKFNFGIVSDDQMLIKNAVDSAIYIIRQDYALIDTVDNKRYTQDNQEYFGRYYTAAMMIDSVLWTDTDLLEPWLSDTSFSYYNKRYGWKPILTQTWVRPIVRNDFEKLDFEYYKSDSVTDSVLSANSFLLLHPKNLTFNSLKSLSQTTDSTGWAFILYSEQNFKICDTCAIKYSIFKANPNFTNTGKLEKQVEIKNMISGFYILGNITTGNISFYAGGFVRKLLNYYVKPFIDLPSKELEIEIIEPHNENVIEINKKSKKRKGNKND